MLEGIIGHERVVSGLQYALTNQLVNHAYLFGGPSGVGKKTTAMSFARALLRPKGEEAGFNPDLHIIRPEGGVKSNAKASGKKSIKINQLRDLQNNAFLTAFGAGRQVYIIEQADKMTDAAANCLLKILEEPPRGVVFILVTDNLDGLLPTILSRCQLYRFTSLTVAEVMHILTQEYDKYDNIDSVRTAAELSGGSPGRALAVLQKHDKRERMLDLLIRLVRERPVSTLVPTPELDVREDLEEFINYLILVFRDVLLTQYNIEELSVNVDRQSMIRELALIYQKREVMDILIYATDALNLLTGSINQRLVLDGLLFKLG